MTEPLGLDSPVTAVAKVTARDATRLEKLGVRTVRDLLLSIPFDLQSYGGPVLVSSLRSGDHATVVGTIVRIAPKFTKFKKMKLTEAVLRDDEAGLLEVVWFNMPWVAQQMKAGDRVALAGVVSANQYGRRISMRNPLHELMAGTGLPRRIGGLMPKYHLTAGLTSRRLADLVAEVLPLAEGLEDALPAAVRERQRLMPIADAIRAGHQPLDAQDWQDARHRMAFAELFELQTAFAVAKRGFEQEYAAPIPYVQEVIEAFKAGVGFELTRAQRRSAWEIYQDMARPVPMNRLLNGDVGSGKTAVAAAAVAMAHAGGYQSVVMAPTEILARQHLHRFRAYLEASFPGLTVELLVSGLPAAERRRVRMAAASGHCTLVVGTHALIEEEVQLANLGLAVVDEQHRFGTRQRELLRLKAGRGRPHFLAMTATPIPRSLALALYGDMALSVIDELPPGRTPVQTRIVQPSERTEAYDLVRAEVRAGRQAFVICPLIDESLTLEVKAATAEYERLQSQVFPDLRVSLVHGRMRDKDSVMRAFRDGESDILVATAVIEVGVDIPNASVVVIEGSERFGLAQLHQFRGRVGRGSAQSHCLLLTDDAAGPTLDRLALMERISDGFRLAEEDMEIRGAGELIGARQHGLADLAMQGLRTPALLHEAREEADALIKADPDLAGQPNLLAAVRRRLDQTSVS